MCIRTWCKLNKVPPSILYYWINHFRNHEPEMFDSSTRKGWIELSRDLIKAKSALAVVGQTKSVTVSNVDSNTYFNETNCAPIMVNFPCVTIAIPSHTQKADIQNVVEVIANLWIFLLRQIRL